MNIRILDTSNKKDVNLFKSFPFKLYRKNQYWVPPMPGEIEFVMNRDLHPFYHHSQSDFFVVESGKEIIGRIAVLHNQRYCAFHKENKAFFYYYESVEDQNIADMLFSAAADWARKRNISELYGPRGFSRSTCIGLLVDGFDQQPATGMTYNLPYYEHQLIKIGFEKKSDHFSGEINHHLDQTIHDVSQKVLSRGNFKVFSFHSSDEILEWIPRLDEIHHRAFSKNPDFMPSSKDEFRQLCSNIIKIADPRYIKLILHDKKIAGFLIAYPNINNGLRAAKGSLYPFGWLCLWLDKKFSRVIDLNGVGLLPEYQGLGGNAVLYSEIDRVLNNRRFKRGEIVQVDERNFRSISDMKTMQVTWNKKHRTFSLFL